MMDLIARHVRTRRSPARTSFPIRSGLNGHALAVLELIALLFPFVVAAVERGAEWLWVLTVALIIVPVWQRIFAEVRQKPFDPDGVVMAVACAIALPASTPLWQLAVALSFGIVVGQEIFGSRGHNFLNPATVALAFLIFAFPSLPLAGLTLAIGLSVVPGAVLLLAVGLISWRVVVGAIAGLLLTSAFIATSLPTTALMSSAFLFGLVFLIADPVAAASTNPGRWIYGIFAGTSTALLAGGGTPTLEIVIAATLLAGILAPLIDSCTLKLHAMQRGRRHE